MVSSYKQKKKKELGMPKVVLDKTSGDISIAFAPIDQSTPLRNTISEASSVNTRKRKADEVVGFFPKAKRRASERQIISHQTNEQAPELQIEVNAIEIDSDQSSSIGSRIRSNKRIIAADLNAGRSLPSKKNHETAKKTAKKCQDEISDIDYKSWKWQPVLRLDRITQRDIDTGKGPSTKTLGHVTPIHFDKDESFIREASPQTAFKEFEKRILAIKKSMQPIPTKPSNIKPKRVRIKRTPSEHQLMYEEAHKSLQQGNKSTSNGTKNTFGRRLYSHENLSDELEWDYNQNENKKGIVC